MMALILLFYRSGGVKSFISTRNNAFCIDVNSTNERLRIQSDGKLIVSTNANTTTAMDYAGIYFDSDNSTAAEGLFVNNIAANTGDNASISFSTDSGNRKKSAISHVDTGNYGRGDLVFSIDPDADSGELDIVAHEKLRITSAGIIQCGTSGVLKAEINNAVSGHQFISQCADNNNGFEIYQQHGSTATRNTLAVYANTGTSGAKQAQFIVRGDGKVGIGTDDPKQNVSITNGRVNIDSRGDYYGVWIDGDTTATSAVNIGRWHNTGGRIKMVVLVTMI